MNREKKDTLKFSRLHIADLSFRQVRALADQLTGSPIDPLALTLTPQMAGIVVTYAKNFVGANGFGPLTDLFPESAQFSDSNLAETHEKILEARHRLYAHRDAAAAAKFDYDNESQAEPYQVRISIYEDGSGFTARPNVPELNPAILPSISTLASFQIERIANELKRLWPSVAAHGSFKPGMTYTLGGGRTI
jgi:hypothetical protein